MSEVVNRFATEATRRAHHNQHAVTECVEMFPGAKGNPALLAPTTSSAIFATPAQQRRHKETRMARMNLTQNLGMLLLGVWLILSGLIALLGLSFQGLPLLMGILALIAGILIVLRR